MVGFVGARAVGVTTREANTVSTSLVKHDSPSAVAIGTVLAQSGYFSDAKQAAQAAVKVMAGEEVGLGPVASMTGIHIVQGKVTLGANIIAALVRRHPDYDYEVSEHTDQACEIRFTYRGKPAGTSRFTMDDAAKAGLTKNPTWKAHPRNMLFARAMSNGAKWYAPDVSAGAPLYTPDELGAEVDGATLEVVRLPAQDVRTPQEVAAEVLEPSDPYLAEVVREAGEPLDAQPSNDGFDGRAAFIAMCDEYGEDATKDAFRAIGITSTKDVTPEAVAQVKAALALGGEAVEA